MMMQNSLFVIRRPDACMATKQGHALGSLDATLVSHGGGPSVRWTKRVCYSRAGIVHVWPRASPAEHSSAKKYSRSSLHPGLATSSSCVAT